MCLRWDKLSYLCLLVLLILSACTNPQQQFDALAKKSGLFKKIIAGKQFDHVIYFNQTQLQSSTLHVYLEGDGSPWSSVTRVSQDPTPKKPVMLHLMGLDDHPSLFLGRPCYHGMSAKASCYSELWTSGRYSEIILHSMELVLRQYINQFNYNKLVFIGHSGGGTIAMLLAKRFTETNAVVTIAGNLNPSAWTEYHNYTPLQGSLNPTDTLPLSIDIHQYHLAGLKDTNIPTWIIKKAVKHQTGAEFVVINDFTHNCCWEKIWTEVLKCLEDTCQLKNRI